MLDFALISAGLYVAFQIFADILSVKLAVLPILNLAIDGGTFIYPLTFTLRDFLHKAVGKARARQVVILAAAINLVMVGLFWLIGQLPADESWTNQEAFEAILLPIWRITIASIVAEVVSGLIDTEIFSYFVRRFKSDVGGALASNAVALTVDSLIFVALAFAFVWPLAVVIEIFWANIVIKGVIALGSAPLVGLVPTRAKEEEM